MQREAGTWPLARADLDGYERPGTRPSRCLLLHGFTASPREVLPLAHALSAAGFPVTAIRLPGHGTHVADLERTRAEEWIAAAEAALDIAARSGPAFVAGQSMGGLLALLLAARHPEKVRAVASLAAPMWFFSQSARMLEPLFRYSQLWRLVRYTRKGLSDLPAEALAAHYTYDRFPVRGVMALADVIRKTRRELPQVKAPLLVVHGRLDRSAPFEGAQVILDGAGASIKKFVEFPRSHHLLTLDVDAAAVCAAVASFFVAQAEATDAT